MDTGREMKLPFAEELTRRASKTHGGCSVAGLIRLSLRCFPFCFVFGGAEVEPKASCMLGTSVLFSVSTPKCHRDLCARVKGVHLRAEGERNHS